MREDQILPHLAAVAILLASGGQPGGNGTVQVAAPAGTAGLIDRLRASGAVLIYDPETRTTGTGLTSPVSNDHPTRTSRAAPRWTCRFSGGRCSAA